MIALTADGLRKIAAYLDALTAAERDYDIECGGHSGYAEITLKVHSGPNEVLRVRSAPRPLDADGAPGVSEYCLEIEVP